MNKVSRRELAHYAADQLLSGTPGGKVAKQLAAVLVSSQRAHEADLLANDIAWELESRGKFAAAKVTSAHSLSPNLREQLLAAVKRATAVETLELEEVTDATVLGGLRVDTAVHSWDETVARRLNDLKGVV